MENKRRSAILQNMQRLRALRLARSDNRIKSRKRKRWRDTQTTTAENYSRLQSLPMSQLRRGSFVKKNFSALVTFAELHCSAI
jgi:hypothetical protein